MPIPPSALSVSFSESGGAKIKGNHQYEKELWTNCFHTAYSCTKRWVLQCENVMWCHFQNILTGFAMFQLTLLLHGLISMLSTQEINLSYPACVCPENRRANMLMLSQSHNNTVCSRTSLRTPCAGWLIVLTWIALHFCEQISFGNNGLLRKQQSSFTSLS